MTEICFDIPEESKFEDEDINNDENEIENDA